MNYFLVTGAPRSGTTLFQQILNTHPHIACFHEYDLDKLNNYIDAFFSQDRLRSSLNEILAANVAENSHERVVSTPTGVEPAPNTLQSPWKEPYPIPQRNRDFHNIVNAIAAVCFAKDDLLAVGDKLPNVMFDNYITSLRKTYTNLVTIFVLRHPFDVVRSSLARSAKAKIGEDFWHIHTVDQAVQEWVKNWEFAASQRDAGDVLFIRYEDLYTNFEQQMARVADLLGVENTFGNILAREDQLDRSFSLTSAQRQHIADRVSALGENWRKTDVIQLLSDHPVLPYVVTSGELINVDSSTLDLVLREGFYATENWGAWTEGTQARLTFAIKGAKEAEDIWLDVAYAGFVGPFDNFVFGIRVNGGNLEIVEISGEHAVSHKANFGRMYRVKNGVMEITISVPRPKKPAHDPIDETRALGFGIKSLCVTII